MIDIYSIMEKYQPTDDPFAEEEDDTPSRRLKEIIFNNLDEVDRRVILLYAEVASLRKLSKIIGVSPTACHFRVRQIRKKIDKALNPDQNKKEKNENK